MQRGYVNAFSDAIDRLHAKISVSGTGTVVRIDIGYLVTFEHETFKTSRFRSRETFCEDIGEDFFDRLCVLFSDRSPDDSFDRRRTRLDVGESKACDVLRYRYVGTPFDLRVSFCARGSIGPGDERNAKRFPLDDLVSVVFRSDRNAVGIVVDLCDVLSSGSLMRHALHRCFLIVRDLVLFLEDVDESRERLEQLVVRAPSG